MEEDEYIGEVRLFAGDFAPEGWALCNGAAYSVSEYQALYSVIGTLWGDDGPTRFRVPDLRDRVPIGQGQGVALTPRSMGTYGGFPSVVADLPPHTHKFHASRAAADQTGVTSMLPGVVTADNTVQGLYIEVAGTEATFSDKAIQQAGAGTSHDNHMPSFALTYIICMNGLYPDLN